ncbi:hypothetical protein ACO2Q3_07730 [Caulobacter sp. KR2-114]|uniref:hypothetical protein n=1 Tax=Caulobacter sp. KR2-114 TaxID=3400912 RepID=UPI003BFCF448
MPPFIPFVSDDEIATIGRGLIDRSLPKPLWTHAAHFAAAVWLMRERPDLDLPRDMPPMIRAYNAATGVANTDTSGYHETITLASLRAAAAFLQGRPAGEPLHLSCNALMASPLGNRDWLLSYWSRERLFSAAARRAWAAPDLAALPF